MVEFLLIYDILSSTRINVNINDQLLRAAKHRAAEAGVPLREIIDGALRQYLSETIKKKPFKLRWKPHDLGVIQPDVFLESADLLHDLMDEPVPF